MRSMYTGTRPPGEAVWERDTLAAGMSKGVEEGGDGADRAAFLLLRGKMSHAAARCMFCTWYRFVAFFFLFSSVVALFFGVRFELVCGIARVLFRCLLFSLLSVQAR